VTTNVCTAATAATIVPRKHDRDGADYVQVAKEYVVDAAKQSDTESHRVQLESHVVVRKLGVAEQVARALIQKAKPRGESNCGHNEVRGFAPPPFQ
jgi:hypothetical protein